ncbi:MAG: hypothetical protein FWE22_07595 [Firmicutes bacterium]|nr:hypothetical protein [Bacillota bacterium]
MKTKRKSILSAMIIIMLVLSVALGMFVGCSSNREFSEEDFRLTLEVSQTEARVGDTIVATATFENLSGRRLRLVTSSSPILLVSVFHSEEEVRFSRFMDRRNSFLRRNAVIERTIEWTAKIEGVFYVVDDIQLTIVRRFNDPLDYWTQISMTSERIKITIQGEK